MLILWTSLHMCAAKDAQWHIVIAKIENNLHIHPQRVGPTSNAIICTYYKAWGRSTCMGMK